MTRSAASAPPEIMETQNGTMRRQGQPIDEDRHRESRAAATGER
jgi:hypothetical protein